MFIKLKNILAIIPARGNSKGIPRKNLRLLNGKPLIYYAIHNIKNSRFSIDACVTTDNEEIAEVSKSLGIDYLKRDGSLAEDNITLDPVIFDAYKKMASKKNKRYDVVITLQPTSPLLRVETLDKAIQYFIDSETIDTLISGVNRPHLSWGKSDDKFVPKYKERVNRQFLPSDYVETGAFLITKSENVTNASRMGKNISIYEIEEKESIDIDTPQDWWVAENELSKKNIMIRVEAYSKIGMGHVYRGLTLAYSLIHHNIIFVTSDYSNLAIKKLEESFFPYIVISSEDEIVNKMKEFKCDIFINDNLNSSLEYTIKLKETDAKLVSFEDLGVGTQNYDAVINDLYSPQIEYKGTQYYWGSDYYLLRDEFLISNPSEFRETAKNILIIFGGVDPNNLTMKVINSLDKVTKFPNINFKFVVGPGYENLKQIEKIEFPSNVTFAHDVKAMSSLMKEADLAISSQGRTMLELAAMGVPTILLAQNERELTHEFGYLNNGFINLGLGSAIDTNSIASTINWLVDNPDIRLQMRKQMLSQDLRNGLNNVLKIILG